MKDTDYFKNFPQAIFSKLFHQASKNTHLLRTFYENPLGISKDTPEEWSTMYYKTYPRLPKIDLAECVPPAADFFRLVQKRRSRRDLSGASITKDELSLLLQYTCGIVNKTGQRRAQPSGGARFPIEMYPVVFRAEGNLDAGLYHYLVKAHQLDMLWKKEFSQDDMRRLCATDIAFQVVKNAAVLMVMTAVFWRNQNKYNERGYRIILQESGHIGQNIYLAAEALGLKCCALSGTWDENLEKLLDIDGVTESVVYTVAVGK